MPPRAKRDCSSCRCLRGCGCQGVDFEIASPLSLAIERSSLVAVDHEEAAAVRLRNPMEQGQEQSVAQHHWRLRGSGCVCGCARMPTSRQARRDIAAPTAAVSPADALERLEDEAGAPGRSSCDCL